jgi:hypothetical protein
MIDQKNMVLPKQIIDTFWLDSYFFIIKKPAFAVSHRTITLRMMSNNRSTAHPTVLYMYDQFLNRYVTPQMKKLSVTLLAGCLIFWGGFSAIGTILSACFFSRQVSIDYRCWPAFLLLIIHSVAAKWETAASIFLSKSWKLTPEYLKICSSNPKCFRIRCSHPQPHDTISLNRQDMKLEWAKSDMVWPF